MVPKFVRKHAVAIVAFLVYNFAVFYPVAFMDRLLSPNDVFQNFQPWSSLNERPVTPQNALLNDPPTAYYTIFSMVKSDWRTFHWNPYLAAGVPGWGSSASAVLSPFVLLPLLLVPLDWVFTLLVFLKINAAFVFAYLWLREEHLGRRGAATGAVVVAGASVYAVRFLWQITNVTALFPALLWLVTRAMRGKPVSIAVTTLIALSYALAGFPAAMAYGVYVVGAYAIALALRWAYRTWKGKSAVPDQRALVRSLLMSAAAVAVALMIAAPSIVPFAQFIRRTGYLQVRQATSLTGVFPAEHWRNLVESDRLGHPALKNWRGDHRLGVLNNYVETTIYLGAIVLFLAVAGLLNRRARMRWFWLVAALVMLGCIFGAPLIAPLVARLPGFKYSALARTALLLPLPIGYLAAAGASRLIGWIRRYPLLRNALAFALASFISFDLGLVAGRFHPYLPPAQARVPSTPMLDFLHAERGPFRVLPFFDYFWPNAAELFRIEDVRSHFSSEREYRRLLQRLEPDVWSGRSTVLQFNSLKYNFADRLAGMLGIRYYIEHPAMDIIKWSIFAGTRPGVAETGIIRYGPGALFRRTITVGEEPFYAIEIPARIESVRGAKAGLELTLFKDGRQVWSRLFSKAHANVMDKLYVPLAPFARNGETVTLVVRSHGASGFVPSGDNPVPGETKLYYARVGIPVIFDRELRDGRLYRNVAELPRFWPVRKLRALTDAEFLATPEVDFSEEAILTGPNETTLVQVYAAIWARVRLTRYEPHEQAVASDSPMPFFLASSEKLTPELAVFVDGKRVEPVEINGMFAGVRVPSGRHEIVYSRRLARGWWWLAIAGVAAWLAIAVLEATSSLRRRRSGTRRAIARGASFR